MGYNYGSEFSVQLSDSDCVFILVQDVKPKANANKRHLTKRFAGFKKKYLITPWILKCVQIRAMVCLIYILFVKTYLTVHDE